VPVIVELAKPPAAPALSADPATIAAVKSEIAAVQNAIIGAHFGSVANPRPGAGFERALQVYDMFPMFALPASKSEFDALAADPRIVRIHENTIRKTSL
jgi:hypothetical protein